MKRVIYATLYLCALTAAGEARADIASWTGVSASDRLGWAMANAGDVNDDGVDDIIIGVPNRDVNGYTDRGIAYVYSGAGPSTLLLTLEPSAEHDYDVFGFSVAGIGDVDGDGNDDVMVGAPVAACASQPPSCTTRAGRVYVFSGDTGSEIETIAGAAAEDFFGFSVAGGASVESSGVITVGVGAPGANSGDGKAYFYRSSGSSGWTQLGSAIAGASSSAENLGSSVLVMKPHSTSATRVYIGAPFYDDGANADAGRVVSYTWNSGSSSFTSLLESAGDAAGDLFGFSLAAAPGLRTGSYINDLLVGAPGYDSDRGRVYALKASSAGFPDLLSTSVTGANSGDAFGWNVASIPDVNGDSEADVVVGAPGWASETGATYVYTFGMETFGLFPLVEAYRFDGQATGDLFGFTVAGLADVDGDGRGDVLTGAPELDSGGSADVGKAYLYNGCPVSGFGDDFNDDSLERCRWQVVNAEFEGKNYGWEGPYGKVWEGTGGQCVMRMTEGPADAIGNTFDAPFAYQTISGDFTLEAEITLSWAAGSTSPDTPEWGGIIIADGSTMGGSSKAWLAVALGDIGGATPDRLIVRKTLASTSTPETLATAAAGQLEHAFVKVDRSGDDFDVYYKLNAGDSWTAATNPKTLSGIGTDLEVGFGTFTSKQNYGGLDLAVNSLVVTPTSGTGIDENFDSGDCEDTWTNLRNGANGKLFGQDHNELVIGYVNASTTSIDGSQFKSPHVLHKGVADAALDFSVNVRATFHKTRYLGAYLVATNPPSGLNWVGLELAPVNGSSSILDLRGRSTVNNSTSSVATVTDLGSEATVRIKRSGTNGDAFDLYYWKPGCMGGGGDGWKLVGSVTNSGFAATSPAVVSGAVALAVSQSNDRSAVGEFDDLGAPASPNDICP